MKYMNKLGYPFLYDKKNQSGKNLLAIESMSSSSINSNSNSNSQINDRTLSDDELIVSKISKEENDKENDEDYELVLNNDKEVFSNKEINKNNCDKNNDGQNQNDEILCEKLIRLIKKNDFDKMKLFFIENKLAIKKDESDLKDNNNSEG